MNEQNQAMRIGRLFGIPDDISLRWYRDGLMSRLHRALWRLYIRRQVERWCL